MTDFLLGFDTSPHPSSIQSKTHFCNYNYLPVIKHGNGKSTIYTQDDLPTNTSIESGFPIATFDYRRVSLNISFSDSAIFNRRIDISAIGATSLKVAWCFPGQLGSSKSSKNMTGPSFGKYHHELEISNIDETTKFSVTQTQTKRHKQKWNMDQVFQKRFMMNNP